jgi:hypothetical protein
MPVLDEGLPGMIIAIVEQHHLTTASLRHRTLSTPQFVDD